MVILVNVICTVCPQSVTRGARKKIVQSICRLVKRPETLLDIEQVRTSILPHPLLVYFILQYSFHSVCIHVCSHLHIYGMVLSNTYAHFLMSKYTVCSSEFDEFV